MTSQTIAADFAKISNFTKLITEIHNCSRFMADDILDLKYIAFENVPLTRSGL